MELPTKEEINQGAINYFNKSMRIMALSGTDYEKAKKDFIEGAEWMEQQLEPIITEYGMNEIKLKEKIAELEQYLWDIYNEGDGESYDVDNDPNRYIKAVDGIAGKALGMGDK